ncbi:molecular chaperone [Fimicolochytrium jonesii]|uniref:molecular chaperone n=1 Tax=Fimicolochytrium jonesii TaxID=1396493 RepID=UPI0022FE2717|nr:molecular chaperone [Fimicolochytrium jonesii]KAI8820848.1 molecular chaperone [Fimicolochytrium jonesii]
MASKGSDFLSLLVASRAVLNSIARTQRDGVVHYARTSSIPRAVSEVWDARRAHGVGQKVGTEAGREAGGAGSEPVTYATPVGVKMGGVEEAERAGARVSTAGVVELREVSRRHFAKKTPPQSKPAPPTPATYPSPLLSTKDEVPVTAATPTSPASSTDPIADAAASIPESPLQPRAPLRQSRVPASRVGRLWHYGSLVAGVGVGTFGEAIKRATGMSEGGGSPVLSQKNVQRIVSKLSQMRGAALKLGQMLSIQDNSMLPKELEDILLRVQNSANYMPDSQLQSYSVQLTLRKELGDDWRAQFSTFDMMPLAAASIGQVHRATLPSGLAVAVKVQYPGVASSIDSDLDNLRTLILFSNFLPKGLYLDNTIRVARKELAWECDYTREAAAMSRFASLIADDAESYHVPKVIPHLSTRQILTTEFVTGTPLGSPLIAALPQHTRDSIAERVLRLCLREVFEFRFMQTDPNWSNFLYDVATDRLHLLDFGAAREFSGEFVEDYRKVLQCAAKGDREGCAHWSTVLGFLTGVESVQMTNAHVNSILTLAEPFSSTSPTVYDFATQDVTTRVRAEIPLMLRERLTPPPDETYSLHRKLSGAFLLCAKLRARVRCREVFERFAYR